VFTYLEFADYISAFNRPCSRFYVTKLLAPIIDTDVVKPTCDRRTSAIGLRSFVSMVSEQYNLNKRFIFWNISVLLYVRLSG